MIDHWEKAERFGGARVPSGCPSKKSFIQHFSRIWYHSLCEGHLATKEAAMPGWTGCDVCGVIDALRVELGGMGLPDGSTFDDAHLRALEERLSAARDAPLAQRALIVAEGLRDIGRIETALQISEAIPRIITLSDPASAALLGRALISRA